jgi:hypothetical protein
VDFVERRSVDLRIRIRFSKDASYTGFLVMCRVMVTTSFGTLLMVQFFADQRRAGVLASPVGLLVIAGKFHVHDKEISSLGPIAFGKKEELVELSDVFRQAVQDWRILQQRAVAVFVHRPVLGIDDGDALGCGSMLLNPGRNARATSQKNDYQ